MLTRRSLIRSLMTFGCLSASALARSSQPSVRNDGADTPYDVVVVGSGMAGHCAALAAAEAGAERVLLLEKGPILGGHTLYSAGSVAVISPKRQKAQGIEDSVERLVAESLALSPSCNTDMIRFIAERSEDAVDWLESEGVEFSPFLFQAVGGMRVRCLGPKTMTTAKSYIVSLHRACQKAGVKTLLSTAVTDIRPTMNPSDAARWTVTVSETGPNGEKLPGNSLRTIRTKGIVLATGGFSANVAMRLLYDPRLTHDMRTTANPQGLYFDGATGDGIVLAQALGAQTADMDKFLLLAYWGGRLLDYAGAEIYVNKEGRRFVNEEASTGRLSEAIMAQPERSMWVITDSRSAKGANVGVKLLSGIVKKSDTVEEMARGMGIDPAVLKATLQTYNANCKKGADPAFGRKSFTQTIDHPPYYWGMEELSVHMTFGGLIIDRGTRVLRTDRSPIEGLWAAGEVVGGIFGTDRLGGMALAQALVFGREAGRQAAAYAAR